MDITQCSVLAPLEKGEEGKIIEGKKNSELCSSAYIKSITRL